jgi:hypothetical protein
MVLNDRHYIRSATETPFEIKPNCLWRLLWSNGAGETRVRSLRPQSFRKGATRHVGSLDQNIKNKGQMRVALCTLQQAACRAGTFRAVGYRGGNRRAAAATAIGADLAHHYQARDLRGSLPSADQDSHDRLSCLPCLEARALQWNR